MYVKQRTPETKIAREFPLCCKNKNRRVSSCSFKRINAPADTSPNKKRTSITDKNIDCVNEHLHQPRLASGCQRLHPCTRGSYSLQSRHHPKINPRLFRTFIVRDGTKRSAAPVFNKAQQICRKISSPASRKQRFMGSPHRFMGSPSEKYAYA